MEVERLRRLRERLSLDEAALADVIAWVESMLESEDVSSIDLIARVCAAMIVEEPRLLRTLCEEKWWELDSTVPVETFISLLVLTEDNQERAKLQIPDDIPWKALRRRPHRSVVTVTRDYTFLCCSYVDIC